MKKTINLMVFFLIGFPCLAQLPEESRQSEPAKLLSEVLPADGRHSTILTVQDFGRYAVAAQSAQGTALQYVDRMAGPGEISGIPGEQDGRLDLFLNRGEYKIITHAHEAGTGEVKLTARAFSELNGTHFPQLVKLKTISLSLDDFQQRSFWLHVLERETVAIEAAGRNLADLRLWKDGNWLLDAPPQSKRVDPRPGKPLHVQQLNVALEPGLYLMTVYGGPALPWAEQSDAHPLYIRYGIARLDESGQRQYTLSEFGSDRYLVPGNSNYFHLSVPEATAITMTADTFRQDDAFSDSGSSAQITKKSIPPVAQLELSTQSRDRVVTIGGLAGQSYVLQHFEKRWRYSFYKPGKYWLSTIHSGDAGDSVDATSILTRWPRYGGERYEDSRAVKLDSAAKYERRFNLLDTLTLYLQVSEPGNYIVKGQGEGVKAQFRIEPFLTRRPEDYEAPPFEDSGYKWNLDAGFYVLTARPQLKGILTLTVEKEAFLPHGDSPLNSVAGATRYGPISLHGDSYTLYINQQPGVRAGVVLRPIPVDLSTALPVMQFAREELSIPVTLPEAGTVQAITIYGEPLEISQDKRSWTKSLNLHKGDYELAIRNLANDTVNYSLEFAPARLRESTPLPEIDPKTLRSIPDFPILSAKQPEYFELDRNQPATYLVKVDKPALYRLETSGLLETQGNLRTRTIPTLVRQQANGVGRNFLIQQYLREGDYQLTLQPRSNTRGHLGLRLSRTDIEDGGLLTTDVASRATLKAGKGLLYRFNIPSRGTYRLRAIGVDRTYVMRVEDADGWPILAPNIDADVTQEFDPGEYRIVIRPEAVDARVVTTLQAVAEPVKFQGHGPHRIAVNQAINHLWQEPVKGAARLPDTWTFDLPAAADTTITLSNEMQGELVNLDDDAATVLAVLSAVRPWQDQLSAGHYQLAVTNLRKNNRVDYHLQIAAKQLMIGQQRQVSPPASIAVSVGDEGFIELSSYGQSDVRGSLYDTTGALVARGDDRSNDWNFLIAQKLPAGEYRLEVDAMGEATQPTTVSMRAPRIHMEEAQSLPLATTIGDTQAHIFPLRLSGQGSLLVIQAQSEDAVGISLERKNGGNTTTPAWLVLGTHMGKTARLLLPLANTYSSAYRLRVWSVDRRGASISLNVQAVEPKHSDERSLADVSLTPLSDSGSPAVAIAAVDITRPGVFRADDAAQLFWSSQADQVFTKVQNGLMSATGKTLWVAITQQKSAKAQKAHKLKLSRVYLGSQGGAALQVLVPAHQVGHIDINTTDKTGEHPLLAIAEARAGQAGIQLIEQSVANPAISAQRFAIAQHAAVSILVNPKQPIATVWNASDGHQALEVSLRQMQFQKVYKLSASAGEVQQTLQASGAMELALPEGRKRLNLIFPPNTAAALLRGNDILSSHWSGNSAINEELTSDADNIVILNAAAEAQHIRLTVDRVPSTAALSDSLLSPVVAEDRMFERRVSGVGQLRLPVSLGKENRRQILRVRGPARAVYMQNNGRVLRGNDLTIESSGELIVEHQAGVVLAWLEPQPSNSPQRRVAAQPLDLSAPQSVVLQGREQFFRMTVNQGIQMLLRSDTPIITRIVYSNGGETVEAHPEGMNYSLYLPPGASTLELIGIGPAVMNGVAYISAAPIESIMEGFGPETILSGGGMKLYGFDVKEQGAIGLGIKASADVVSGLLMDEAGKVINRGVVQMPQLSPGHYVFAVSVPNNSLPVRVRPALVGIDKPPTGPPLDVIKQYLDEAGLKLNR